MKGNRKSLMGLGLLALGLVALTALGPGSVRGGAADYLAKLWINDNFSPYQALFSDRINSGWYIDHRIPGSEDSCVTAWVKGGLFFIYMDYTGETGFGCSESLELDPRTYDITLLDICDITDPKNFRIRAEKLFSGKSTTPVAFLFYDQGISYEVRPDTEVPITVLGNTRTLTYSSTATLWRITKLFKTEKTPVAICQFSFPFQITVERVAAP